MTETAKLEEALMPFARLYALNRPLNLDDSRPMSHFVPGEWPTMRDCRRAYEALGSRYETLRDK